MRREPYSAAQTIEQQRRQNNLHWLGQPIRKVLGMALDFIDMKERGGPEPK
jgi:hypothetical protein